MSCKAVKVVVRPSPPVKVVVEKKVQLPPVRVQVPGIQGAVENYADLPTAPATGDMYNVETADATHGIDAGVNVVWNGTSWDPMAPMITIEAATTTEIDALFK